MIKNIALLVVSLLITLVLVDTITRHPFIALRFVNCPAEYYNSRYPKIRKARRYVKNVDVRANVTGDLAWMRGEYVKDRRIHFKTDSRGFRNYTDKPEKPFDVIILGDSFGVTSKVDQDKTISEQLNQRGYSAYNMSVDGADLWTELIFLKYDLPQLKTAKDLHVIWLVFEGNDLEGRLFYSLDLDKVVSSKTFERFKAIETYLKRSVIRIAFKSIFMPERVRGGKKGTAEFRDFFGKKMLFYQSYAMTLDLTADDIKKHKNYHYIQAIFKDMKRFIDKRGLSITCIFLPTKSKVYEWVYHNKKPWTSDTSQSAFSAFTQKLCRENDIPFIDMTPELIARSKDAYEKDKSALFFLDDTHWNEQGIAIAVSTIDQLLSKKKK
jgi:hypothetical protein